MKTTINFLSYLAQFFLEREMFRTQVLKKTNHAFSRKGAIYDVIWKNIVEPIRPQMTLWRMRILCWIPKAANTHCRKGQYLLLFNCNVGARMRLTVTYVRFLSCFNFIPVLDFLFYFWKSHCMYTSASGLC